eukprot:GILK01008323.1.p1 GENE.GILK01008323.1~~GILK01008323.1.p1  ORF type:complete len:343 (+),score=27.55 GILK01008323.1:78-1106(+)
MAGVSTIVLCCRVVEKWEESVKVANQERVLKLMAEPSMLEHLREGSDYQFTVAKEFVNRKINLRIIRRPEVLDTGLGPSVLYSIGAVFARNDKVLMLENRNSSKFIQFKYKLIELTKKKKQEQVQEGLNEQVVNESLEFTECLDCLDTSPSWLPIEYQAVKFFGENGALERVFRLGHLRRVGLEIQDLKDTLEYINEASDKIRNLSPPPENVCLYSLPKGGSQDHKEEWRSTVEREAREELSCFAGENFKQFQKDIKNHFRYSRPKQISFRCRDLEMPLFVYDVSSWTCFDLLNPELDAFEDRGEFRSFQWVSRLEVFTIDDRMWPQDEGNTNELLNALPQM